MTDKAAKRNRGEVPGLKVLISAGALAATLGGWAVFGIKNAGAAGGATVSAPGQPIPPELAVLAQPLPTVVPPPAVLSVDVPAIQPTPMRRILRAVSIPPPEPAEPDAVSRSSR